MPPKSKKRSGSSNQTQRRTRRKSGEEDIDSSDEDLIDVSQDIKPHSEFELFSLSEAPVKSFIHRYADIQFSILLNSF